MRVEQARAEATDWVREHADALGLVGALVTGSVLGARPGDPVAPESDLDLVAVVDGPAPAKLGKLTHHGVRLDVDFVTRADVSDPAAVAATFYLAPSFAAGAILADPSGQLSRVARQVRAVFAEPATIRARCAGVRARMDAGVAAIDDATSWSETVLRWVFTTSLSTQLLLVAGLRLPTVRRRYLSVRALLADRGRLAAYPDLLDQLGATAVTPATVAAHLDRLEVSYDAAAAVNPMDAPFATDITAANRSAALDAGRESVQRGDHREAVFWTVVTFARGQQILDRAGHPRAEESRADFDRAVADLTGLHDRSEVHARLAALPSHRHRVEALAEQLLA